MNDKKIRFGTTLRSPYDVAQSSREIEALGFDVLGCGEHVSFHGDTANGFISLSVAAGATKDIQLMSAITLIPLYPAALLAKMGAALDVASNGRFILGVGVGGIGVAVGTAVGGTAVAVAAAGAGAVGSAPPQAPTTIAIMVAMATLMIRNLGIRIRFLLLVFQKLFSPIFRQ